MTDIAWPSSVLPYSTGLEPIPNVKAFPNPETGGVTTLERPGHRWRQQLSIPDLSGDLRTGLKVFLMQLRGQSNRVLLPDFSYGRGGPGGGVARVNGGSQTGRALIVDGAPNAITWLKKGDYFSLPNYEMFMLTVDAVTNGSGQVTLAFEPAIRISPANDALVEIDAPRARFMLNTRSAMWRNTADPLDGFYVRSGFTLDFIEAYS